MSISRKEAAAFAGLTLVATVLLTLGVLWIDGSDDHAATAAASSSTTKPAPPRTTEPAYTATAERAATTTATTTITTITTPRPAQVIGSGTYEVGVDVEAGTWRTRGPAYFDASSCMWIRASAPTGESDDIIAGGNVDGPGIVQIEAGEFVTFTGGCIWEHD